MTSWKLQPNTYIYKKNKKTFKETMLEPSSYTWNVRKKIGVRREKRKEKRGPYEIIKGVLKKWSKVR